MSSGLLQRRGLLQVVIIGLIALFCVFSYFTYKKLWSVSNNGVIPVNTANKPNYAVLDSDSFQGEIKRIIDSKLTIEADSQEKNSLLRNRTFEAMLVGQSKIVLYSGGIYTIESTEGTEVFPAKSPFPVSDAGFEEVSASQLSVGDRVLVVSFSDLKQADSFVIKGIYKRR